MSDRKSTQRAADPEGSADHFSSSTSSRSAFLRVFPAVMLPMFLSLIDQTIVASALPDMGVSLGDVENVSWVVLAYLLTASVAAPCYGRLGDLLGRRRLLMTAIVIAMAGSLICALSGSLVQLVIGRIVQGAGGGGLMALSHALIGEAVPPRERAKYQGIFATNGMLASAIGPVVGGWLAASLGWQAIFFATIPFKLLALFLVSRLPNRLPEKLAFRFDTIGMLLFVGTISPFLWALDGLQEVSLAILPRTLLLLSISVICAIALRFQEKRVATPLISIDLVAEKTVWRCCGMAACHGAALIAMLTFVPLYVSLARGVSGADVGLMLLPFTLGIGAGSMLTGLAISRTGQSAIFPAVGLLGATIFIAAFGLLSPALGDLMLGISLFMVAVCLGTTMAVVLVAAQEAAGPSRFGATAGLIQLSRSVGAAIGTACAGVVLFATLRSDNQPVQALLQHVLRDGRSALALAPIDIRNLAIAELQSGFTRAFVAIAVFPIIGSILAWTLPTKKLS